jgi:hypothetical protein
MSIPISNNDLSTYPLRIVKTYTDLNKIVVVYSTNILLYFQAFNQFVLKSVFLQIWQVKAVKTKQTNFCDILRISMDNASLLIHKDSM